MPISIVVGGQFGSEGKGKVAHYLAREMGASYAVRCGGPNSGHTVIDETGKARIFQQLPTASILPNVKCVICAGSYIDLEILYREISETGLGPDRLLIDRDAVIITEALKAREQSGGLIQSIGSTGSGTGAAVAARINREKGLVFAKDIPVLNDYIQDVPSILRQVLDHGERIIIEGTQGFGLSPLHSRLFPFTTSRDTTAAGFLSETGLSPLDVDDVVLTIRAFPIRVAGNSGPLPFETNWETITQKGMHNQDLIEKTSVTRNIRRVAEFDVKIVQDAIKSNNPTRIVLNHLDYLNSECHDLKCELASELINKIENYTRKKINLLGFSQDSLLKKGVS